MKLSELFALVMFTLIAVWAVFSLFGLIDPSYIIGFGVIVLFFEVALQWNNHQHYHYYDHRF